MPEKFSRYPDYIQIYLLTWQMYQMRSKTIWKKLSLTPESWLFRGWPTSSLYLKSSSLKFYIKRCEITDPKQSGGFSSCKSLGESCCLPRVLPGVLVSPVATEVAVRVPGGEVDKNTTTRIYLNKSASDMTAWANHQIPKKNVFSTNFFLSNQL